jgi:OFA family oxalate/formate antiporter-like MFS transporter
MRRIPLLALAAAILLNLCGGFLYSWSVLVEPLERSLGTSRAAVSAVYSVALVGFTLGMFVASGLLQRLRMPVLGFGVCGAMAAGLALAGLVARYDALMAGYALFAAAAGVTYFLCLAAASTELPVRRSVALGLATSAFAVGGLGWPVIAVPLVQSLGVHGALAAVAAMLLAAGSLAALLLGLSGAATPRGDGEREGLFENFFTERPRIALSIWAGFVLLGVGGLMAVSHAAGIAADYGVPESETWLGALVVNLAYVPGALVGGFLSERWGGRRVLIGMGLAVGGPLLLLLVVPSAGTSLAALACVGAAFGASTSTYPVTIAGYYGVARVPAIYGRVSIGYGVAGLTAPYLAGRLHDLAGDYRLALSIAAVVGLASLLPALILPPVTSREATVARQG